MIATVSDLGKGEKDPKCYKGMTIRWQPIMMAVHNGLWGIKKEILILVIYVGKNNKNIVIFDIFQKDFHQNA